MFTILHKIVAAKREELRRAKSRLPEELLRGQAFAAPPVRDFFAAWRKAGRSA